MSAPMAHMDDCPYQSKLLSPPALRIVCQDRACDCRAGHETEVMASECFDCLPRPKGEVPRRWSPDEPLSIFVPRA